ncbi:Hypothetical predicted protein [Podarcis lilfordi]|uniref:Uncharacterized protein n=1 Tax=Podarcis lilfordi TaxID=74358 RepID=A0AA35QQ64_9SAUR|nr:Hypothetical predicted protein [Podarcis lilfordi]
MLQERKGESGARTKRACLHLQQNSPTHQGFETHQLFSPGLAGRLKPFLGLWPLFYPDSFWKSQFSSLKPKQDFLSSHSEEGDGEDSQNSSEWGTFPFIRH